MSSTGCSSERKGATTISSGSSMRPPVGLDALLNGLIDRHVDRARFRCAERAGAGDGARGRVVDLRNEHERLDGRSGGGRQRRLRGECRGMGDHDPALVMQPGASRNSDVRRSASRASGARTALGSPRSRCPRGSATALRWRVNASTDVPFAESNSSGPGRISDQRAVPFHPGGFGMTRWRRAGLEGTTAARSTGSGGGRRGGRPPSGGHTRGALRGGRGLLGLMERPDGGTTARPGALLIYRSSRPGTLGP